MAISAPVILLPTAGTDYTTDIKTQTLSGTTSEDTKLIEVNGTTHGVSYTAGESIWSWTGTLEQGLNTISIVAVEKDSLQRSSPSIINITYVVTSDFVTAVPPTGIRLRRYMDKVEIITAKSDQSNIIGYNFYVYTQSSGLNNVYAKINKDIVSEVSFYEDSTREISRTEDTVGTIRTTTITEEITRNYYYSQMLDETRYNELVQAGSLPNIPFNSENSLFFVITAVLYESGLGEVTESPYSIELEGSPVTINTGIITLPGRTQNDIILTYSSELLVASAGTDTKPGTVLRDVIDPISEEQARSYVIQSFMHRCLSVGALLAFDDADGDEISDPVSSSVLKQALQLALNMTDASQVQDLIDSQFDAMASNVNLTRRGAQPATGTVIFYIETAPIRDMYIYEGAVVATLGDLDAGIQAQSYRTLAGKVLNYQSKESFYNQTENRYEIEVEVEAINAGDVGNTSSYTIKSIQSGVDSDFLVENPNPITFGEESESNAELAARIQLSFFTDTGTEGGYARTAIAIPNVRKVRVEKAGDELMRRDWDPVREEHIGGKVDIYIEGKRSQQVSDRIAFSFESVESSGGLQEEDFTVVNAVSFQFQSKNPLVTSHTPIFEVTKVYNSTKAAEYDIAGYQIIGDGDTIDLNESLPQNQSIGLASGDIIKVDYKYRSSDVFILKNQPVTDVLSVVGDISGELPQDNWELVKLQDPLEEGYSTVANDGIRIKFVNNLPLTEFQTISDEPHVLVVGVDEPLDYIGADIESIKVTNTEKTYTYVENIDYSIVAGSSTEPVKLRLIESGSISNGQRVLVSYVAIENFTINYTTNNLLNQVQEEVDKMKHACADVIVKQAIENKTDFVITIVPESGVTNLIALTSSIRTALSNYITNLGIGRSLTQSEVVHVIKEVDGVDYIVLPFLRMVKADDSLIVRDDIGSVRFQIYNEGLSTSYISVNSVLSFKTTANGGPSNLFRGLFENNMPLMLQEDPLDVSDGPGRGYIQSDGRIVVSTRDGALPDTKEYQAAYYVYGETGSKDIEVNSIEHLVIGSFSITYDTPRELNKQEL